MNCKGAQTRMSAYLDRELTGQELLDLREHLSCCPECRQEEQELRELKTILGSLSAPAPSDDLADRLCATVIGPARVERTWGWRRSVMTFAGVAAASMALTFFVLSLVSHPASAPASKGADVAYDVAQDQAYEFGSDPTMGAPVIPVANYVGSR